VEGQGSRVHHVDALHLGTASIAVAGLIFFREFWDHHTTDEAVRWR